jgi:hypothetical protein
VADLFAPGLTLHHAKKISDDWSRRRYFLYYVDARPTWDDMGILAFGIHVLQRPYCHLVLRRPWQLALAIGSWIPLREILVAHNFGALLALVFRFTGAYSGWFINRMAFKRIHFKLKHSFD